MHAPLSHWLRLLWGTAPRVAFDSECAYIAAGAIHLPAGPDWHHHTAAAAHAAAHLVYSPQRFDGAGLGPVVRVLLALLEDARVEALAVRELPGLARLWRPLHTVLPESGVGFEGLATRLARSLCDPAYDDPHPWVRKGRELCFFDPALSIPAMRTPAELRLVATRLGHDIGQMRLPFNGKAALPLPAYRDDHRWMWAADALADALTETLRPPLGAAVSDQDTAAEPAGGAAIVTHHPEWDRLIARLRPGGCRVVEADAPEVTPAVIVDPTHGWGRRLLAPVNHRSRRTVRPACSDSGQSFELDALVTWQVGHRLRRPSQARVYRRPRSLPAHTAPWLLIDRSASSSAAADSDERGARRMAAQAALALGLALQTRWIAIGVAAISSSGRQAVDWQIVKSYAEYANDAMAGRVQALRPKGSTRLGAVLRHATRRLMTHGGSQRWVLLLSDGSPHDIEGLRLDRHRLEHPLGRAGMIRRF